MTKHETATTAELRQRLAMAEERLAELQWKAAMGELLGVTTHEFNNLLTTIINYAKIGLRRRDDETRDRALQKVLSAGERAAKVTGVVLGMTRRRTERFEPVDLAALVEDSLVLLERELLKYGVRVEKFFQPAPPALANPGDIQRVLLNLVINARQAMSGGGILTIKLRHDAEANTVDLQLRDTGCGIEPDVLPKIFDPYFTTKSGPDQSGKGGSGLGLAACRQIIEAHRGRIRVESAVGKGTAFTIKLPVAEAAGVGAPGSMSKAAS
jgi:signal transduction histidine kinase